MIKIVGQLNTITAPELEKLLGDNLADVDELIFDMEEMEYTSSAGLRAILGAQQDMEEKGGRMIIRKAGDFVMEIFEETGFIEFLKFEQ